MYSTNLSGTQILDHGPLYTETLTMPGDWIVEPWNAWSSIVIALPAVYWAWRLWGNYQKYWFLTLCLPFLFFNGLGSTLFHAFRSSDIFLVMDFAPAALVTLLVSVYLWARVLKKWWWVTLVVLTSVSLRFLVSSSFDPPLSINLSYAVGGGTFLIPLVVLLSRMQGEGWWQILGTFLSFGLALFFRETDTWEQSFLPMGTHFLWHIMTGVGGFFLGAYLFALERNRIELAGTPSGHS